MESLFVTTSESTSFSSRPATFSHKTIKSQPVALTNTTTEQMYTDILGSNQSDSVSSLFNQISDVIDEQDSMDEVQTSTNVESPFEPTPIRRDGMVLVNEVSWQSSALANDRSFFESLKLLVEQPTSTASGDIVRRQACLSRSSTQIKKPSRKSKCRQSSISSTTSSSSEYSASEESSSGTRCSHVEQWKQRYRELVEFHREFHHCLVPLHWPRNPSLAHWVKRQRYQFRIKSEGRHSTLTAERQSALESLGFVWDSHAAGWEERWNELRVFKERYGHCNVPKKYEENPQLAIWVKCQRRQFKLRSEGKSSNMTSDRIGKLLSLGFVFNPRSMKKSTGSLFYY